LDFEQHATHFLWENCHNHWDEMAAIIKRNIQSAFKPALRLKYTLVCVFDPLCICWQSSGSHQKKLTLFTCYVWRPILQTLK